MSLSKVIFVPLRSDMVSNLCYFPLRLSCANTDKALLVWTLLGKFVRIGDRILNNPPQNVLGKIEIPWEQYATTLLREV